MDCCLLYITLWCLQKVSAGWEKKTVNITEKKVSSKEVSQYVKASSSTGPSAQGEQLLGRSCLCRDSLTVLLKAPSTVENASLMAPVISFSSLWVSWPDAGTGCRSCCPRWPSWREQHRLEEAWSSLCRLLDHPAGTKMEVSNSALCHVPGVHLYSCHYERQAVSSAYCNWKQGYNFWRLKE